jgi:hypothetical protein
MDLLNTCRMEFPGAKTSVLKHYQLVTGWQLSLKQWLRVLHAAL